MVQHKLSYKSTVDLEADRIWPNPPTRAEITTAMADVRCNHQVNLTNTYLIVEEAAYQHAVLTQNMPDVQQSQADFATMQQRAEQVLALPAADVLRLSRAQVAVVSSLLVPRVHSHDGT
jgi:hypothetical protein